MKYLPKTLAAEEHDEQLEEKANNENTETIMIVPKIAFQQHRNKAANQKKPFQPPRQSTWNRKAKQAERN